MIRSRNVQNQEREIGLEEGTEKIIMYDTCRERGWGLRRKCERAYWGGRKLYIMSKTGMFKVS